ncbi:MAG: hypothetical protein LBB12_00835 [Holosporaceae bacterium]|jgi:hypothetical protein|nr:hypothetical protein [Holosporaceae bacterium]
MIPHISLIFFALFCFVGESIGAQQPTIVNDSTLPNTSTQVAPVTADLKDLQAIRQTESMFDMDFFYKSISQKFDPQMAKIMASVCVKNTEQMDPSDIHLAIARSLDSCGIGKSRLIIDKTVRLWKRIRTFLGVMRNISLVTAGTSTILSVVFPQWRDILFIVTEISGPLAASLWPTCSYAQKRVNNQIEQNFIENLMRNSLLDAENGMAINPPAKPSEGNNTKILQEQGVQVCLSPNDTKAKVKEKSLKGSATTRKKQTSSPQAKIARKSPKTPQKNSLEPKEQVHSSPSSAADSTKNIDMPILNNNIIEPTVSYCIPPATHAPFGNTESEEGEEAKE